jgi:two-component system sensor histidine kinase KdpD
MGLECAPEESLARLAWRLLLSFSGLATVTFIAHSFSVNSTTVGFAYLLGILVLASTWGFLEAAVTSIAATLTLNFSFLEPVGTFTIADPHNWVALFSFLTTSLIAGRLSTEAKRRALDAIERRQDVERLYSFSRAILLIGNNESFPAQLARKLQDIFQLDAVVLYDRRTGEFHRAGPSDLEGQEARIRDAAEHGSSYSDVPSNRSITAIRLGAEPIASLAVQGPRMPDSVLQGIANLIAIGLERARAQELAHQVEAARRSELLRRTLIDAMAHEFKTPLTSIRAATTSLLDDPDQPAESRKVLIQIAGEEAEHLKNLIDNTVEMAQLDTADIHIQPELTRLCDIVQDVIGSMRGAIDSRPVELSEAGHSRSGTMDRRLIHLALRQLLDNALKYSFPGSPLTIRVQHSDDAVSVEITNRGPVIPADEQGRIFDRFYRSPAVQRHVPGSGLGLTIAQSIVKAHDGDLIVTSHPDATTFRMTLPVQRKEATLERGANSRH